MSGIEIAGLVLGALPVVISALQNYKAGRGPFASLTKESGLLDSLIHRLQHARCVFSVKLETLLLAAGIWIHGQSLQNEHNCIRFLKKKKVARKLKKYLSSSFDNFLLVVERYESCLKRIAAELVNIQRLPNVSQITRLNKHCDGLICIDCERRLAINSDGELGSRENLSISEPCSIHFASQILRRIDLYSWRTDVDDHRPCWWHHPTSQPKKVARQTSFGVPQKAWGLISPKPWSSSRPLSQKAAVASRMLYGSGRTSWWISQCFFWNCSTKSSHGNGRARRA